MNAVPLFI